MTRLVVLLAALLVAAAAVQASQATFTASKTNSGSSFVTAAKFPPTVTLTAPANGSVTNDTTPSIRGTADNAAGDTNGHVKIYSGTSATGRPVQTKHRQPRGHELEPPAPRSRRAPTPSVTQTDTRATPASATPTPSPSTRPRRRRRNITATNTAGGTVGKIESGDTLTYTYSEAIRRRRVARLERLEHRRPHQVHEQRQRHDHRADHRRRAAIKLGSVATNADYVTATVTFNATMAMSSDGASVIVTLGTPSNVSASARPRAQHELDADHQRQGPGGQRGVATAYNETNSDVDF